MSPMPSTRRRRLTALALGLLLPLTACGDDDPAPPATKVGDQVAGRLSELKPGKPTAILTPAGRLSVAFAEPVERLGKGQTVDRTERTAPGGASFVPIVWSFEDDSIYRQLAGLFGERKPVEVELVAGKNSYPLVPPEATTGKQAQYVAVDGDGSDLSLEVTYNKVTQTLDAESGKLDKGVAAGLYDLPNPKLRLRDCPIKSWFTEPGVFPQYTCQYSIAVATPYVMDTWAKPGRTWLAVGVATNLSLYAIGELDGDVASYRVVANKDLSTVNGQRALGSIREQVTEGSAAGTLVFDVKGPLPKKLHILREYKLTLSGAAGKIDAPERRTVKIGGDVDLVY